MLLLWKVNVGELALGNTACLLPQVKETHLCQTVASPATKRIDSDIDFLGYYLAFKIEQSDQVASFERMQKSTVAQ